MDVEARLSALENRLQAAEDQLEIIRLINTYGPLVDSGESETVADLWIDGGVYDIGGSRRAIAPDDLVAMYSSQAQKDMCGRGCSHLTATPRITLHGDTAEAVAYSYVILKEEDRWFLWRAAINHWNLIRTSEGWRIKERYNRTIDGSPASHDTMKRVLK